MELRLYIRGFFVLFFVGLGMARMSGFEPFQGIVFIPQLAFIVYKFLTTKTKLSLSNFSNVSIYGHLLIYITLYCVLFFPRSVGGVQGVMLVPLLIGHVIFIKLAYKESPYLKNPSLLFEDFRWSLLYGALFGFLAAWAYVGFQLKPGLVHNLSYKSPFVRSDLDVPLLTIMFFALGFQDIVKEIKKFFSEGNHKLNLNLIASFLAVLFIFWMYSRRTPIVACLLVIGIYFLPKKNLGLTRMALLFPVLPLFWNLAVQILILTTQNEFVDSLLARNNINDYVTASNRIKSWLGGYLFLFNFKPQHIIGYGMAPAYLRPLDHHHLHNMPLDLFFEAGLITVFTVLLLILRLFKRCIKLIRQHINVHYSLLFMLVAFLFISGVEPTLRTISIAHILFLYIAIFISFPFEHHEKNNTATI